MKILKFGEMIGSTMLTFRRQTISVLEAMTKYIVFLEKNHFDNIIGMELLNEPWVFGDMSIVRDFYKSAIPEIRSLHKTLPLIISDAFRHTEWAWLTNDWPYEHVYMDTHIYHAFNSDDIASSNPSCDKLKQTIAENIACGYGSLLRYKTCTSLPTFVGEWSLAIDDCMGNIRGQDYSVQFHNYGQCDNLKIRVGDPWWTEHVNSFAAKQMYMAEENWVGISGLGRPVMVLKKMFAIIIGLSRMLLKLNILHLLLLILGLKVLVISLLKMVENVKI